MLVALLGFLGALIDETPAILTEIESLCACKRAALNLTASVAQADAPNIAALERTEK